MANDQQMVPPAVAYDSEALRQLFEDTRRRLIDTGTRGRLINVNRKNARGNILNIANGSPDAIYGGAPAPPICLDDATALTEARDQLNAITQALHKPIGASGETAFSVLARQVRYIGIGAAPPSMRIDNLATFTAADEKQVCDAIDSFGTLLGQTGPPARHPLRGIRRKDLQPVDVRFR